VSIRLTEETNAAATGYGTVGPEQKPPERELEVAAADVAGTATDRLRLRRLDDYAIRRVEWLEAPFLQRSAFHLLAGRKGTCKGTYICALAARVSRGELYAEPKRVLVVTSEDSVELDFKPRLLAAGGNEEIVTSSPPYVLAHAAHALARVFPVTLALRSKNSVSRSSPTFARICDTSPRASSANGRGSSSETFLAI